MNITKPIALSLLAVAACGSSDGPICADTACAAAGAACSTDEICVVVAGSAAPRACAARSNICD
jgi:hypothetical protein